jgi:hypothetical protein
MKDKTSVKDQIGFVLNGKPLDLKPTLICSKCGVDRFRDPCPTPNEECPVTPRQP